MIIYQLPPVSPGIIHRNHDGLLVICLCYLTETHILEYFSINILQLLHKRFEERDMSLKSVITMAHGKHYEFSFQPIVLRSHLF